MGSGSSGYKPPFFLSSASRIALSLLLKGFWSEEQLKTPLLSLQFCLIFLGVLLKERTDVPQSSALPSVWPRGQCTFLAQVSWEEGAPRQNVQRYLGALYNRRVS